jgi:hypothetical protein
MIRQPKGWLTKDGALELLSLSLNNSKGFSKKAMIFLNSRHLESSPLVWSTIPLNPDLDKISSFSGAGAIPQRGTSGVKKRPQDGRGLTIMRRRQSPLSLVDALILRAGFPSAIGLYESGGQAPSPAHGQPGAAVLHFTAEGEGASFSFFVVSERK